MEDIKITWITKKTTPSKLIWLKADDKYSLEPRKNAEYFKTFYSDLAENLSSKLPQGSNRFGEEYLRCFYQNLNIKSEAF